ncbi:MAG: YceH family protein [Fibrobacteria bacterium]|nr:YceH family protein [Fibrobacteria bacterium]
MDIRLNTKEIRVLGSLIEKAFTTPEYYPLSLNALKNACNQKSSRQPVVEYTEQETEVTTRTLRNKGLIMLRSGTGSRVQKFEHLFSGLYHLSGPETAIMGVLLLRGPQTIGELKTRTTRMYAFPSGQEVEETLSKLNQNQLQSLALELPRQPGQKETRFTHLLSDKTEEIVLEEERSNVLINQTEHFQEETVPDMNEGTSLASRVNDLETEVKSLGEKYDALKEELVLFRKEFE